MAKRGPKTSPEKKASNFWAKVKKGPGCWIWQGAQDWRGYGRFGRPVGFAHRFSFQLHNGKIPAGAVICHSCDNPSCVRPDHLWAGTRKDNQIDAAHKGRLFRFLSFEKIRAIDACIQVGLSARAIARMFLVDKATVCNIRDRKLPSYRKAIYG